MAKSNYKYVPLAALALVALPIIGAYNSDPHNQLFPDIDSYAGVHSLFVAFSFAVCALIFGAGWYTVNGDRSGAMAFLSAAFLSVGLLEIGHLLSFGGMPRFVTPSGGDKALAFWLAARYAGATALFVIALVPSPIKLTARARSMLMAGGLFYTAFIYWTALFRPDLMPPMFVEGKGLTPFKVWAEYGVVALHVATAILLMLRGSKTTGFSVAPLLAAVILLVASELAFTMYRTGFDNFNVAGHVFKLIAFALIYRAVFVQAVTEPYRRLAESETSLRRSKEHLHLVQRIAGFGFSEVDLASGQAFWSDEVYGLLRLDPARTKPGVESFSTAAHPDDRAKLTEAALKGRRGEPVAPMEFRAIGSDGQMRWFTRVADFVRDDSGRPVSVIATFYETTALKAAEEQLRQSQEHLALAQQIGRIGSVETNIASGESVWSDGLYSILGLDRNKAEAKFETHLAVVHPEDRTKLRALREKDHAGQQTEPAEIRVIWPDGQIRTHLRISARISRQEGVKGRLVVTFQDITDQKKINEALQESEHLLREATAAAKIGIYVHDHAKDTIYWSPELRSIFAVDADVEITLDLIGRLIHPEDSDRIIGAIVRSHDPAGDGRFDVEYRIVRTNGEIGWVLSRGGTVFGGEGAKRRPVRTMGAVFDFTEFKEMDTRNRRSEAHLALAQAVSHIGSVEFDIARNEYRWSEEYCRLLDIDPRERPSNKAFLAAVVPEDQAKIRPISELVAQPGPIEPVVFRVRRPNGEIKLLRRDGVMVMDKDGKPAELVLTLLDITAIKHSEDQRIELERQLAQAQKMEAVGQLTGGVAHDFNNLLAVILGRLTLLYEDLPAGSALRSWVDICVRAAERGASLTRDLLAFSRQQRLQPANLELNTVVGEMTELLRRTLGEAVRIRLTTTPDLWPCFADPGQVQTALLNLAVNARDAMPDGGQLTIETQNARLDADYVARHADVAPGDYVMLSVSDTGTGIPPDVIDRVFEPFFTTKGAGQGSGLGLSMVYGFARQSGGHVNIYSEPGNGTTVKLYLPRAEESAEVEPAAGPSSAPARGQETVLIVEDNTDLRELTQLQLERLGYRVFAAQDAAEGLAILDSHPEIALLLSDVVLAGGLSGPQLVERARIMRPGLAVLMMTGYVGQAASDAAGGIEAEQVLQKPFTLEDLAAHVRDAILEKGLRPAGV